MTESRELARLAELVDSRGQAIKRPSGADTIIVIHLGPGQVPEVAHISRQAWPTVTALNFSEGREFHVRLRRHGPTGVFLVYASVSLSKKTQNLPSIFGDVVQRGRVCRTLPQVSSAVGDLKRELGIVNAGLEKT